jgi:hypothetical protein
MKMNNKNRKQMHSLRATRRVKVREKGEREGCQKMVLDRATRGRLCERKEASWWWLVMVYTRYDEPGIVSRRSQAANRE